jgi:hypothetical protein
MIHNGHGLWTEPSQAKLSKLKMKTSGVYILWRPYLHLSGMMIGQSIKTSDRVLFFCTLTLANHSAASPYLRRQSWFGSALEKGHCRCGIADRVELGWPCRGSMG